MDVESHCMCEFHVQYGNNVHFFVRKKRDVKMIMN